MIFFTCGYGQTGRQSDIATYRAAIVAKNVNSELSDDCILRFFLLKSSARDQ